MPVDRIDQEICTGCGICVAICPQDVLRMDETIRKAVIRYRDDCVACWVCEVFCPVACIETSLDRPRKLPSPWLGADVRGDNR